jgi:hypothetical protein
MKFTLQIKLGNEAMQTGYDIAQALTEVAEKLRGEDDARMDWSGNIRDINGNTVGSWKVGSR